MQLKKKIHSPTSDAPPHPLTPRISSGCSKNWSFKERWKVNTRPAKFCWQCQQY